MPKADTLYVYRRAALFGLIYFAAAASMISLTRFSGGVATVWLASAVLIPELATANRRAYRATIAACATASFSATCLFGFGLVAAAPLMIVNMAEAMIIAEVLRRFGRQTNYLDSLDGFATFAFATAIGAIAGATMGAAITAYLGKAAFIPTWRDWLTGHGMGVLTFVPVISLLLNGEFRRWIVGISQRERNEAVFLLGLLATVSILVFNSAGAPVLFVPILPLMIVTFRLDRPGAALAIVMLAIIGGIFTLLGRGPINIIAASPAWHAQMLQAYLAITTLTALPVAAELKERRDIFRRLLDSEARYKLITESASDMIVSIDPSGLVRYASPSVLEVTGHSPQRMIGVHVDNLIDGPHREIIVAAYRAALETPGGTSLIEYQASIASGEMRWFETNIRSILDESGAPCGVVSATRDISQRKELELRLAHAATTDSLTGLANRRKFDALLDREIEDRRSGTGRTCIAIFDIDYFKSVNDAHGHAVGDLVLATFAAAALRVLRAGDHIARLGGEEFGLILSGADLDQASRVCERLRQAVAQDITLTSTGAEVSITVSAGLAEVNGTSSRLQLMHAADEALYRAKAGGRDQLAIAA